jgi:hypothetical protein
MGPKDSLSPKVAASLVRIINCETIVPYLIINAKKRHRPSLYQP